MPTARRIGPFLVAALLLALGYLHYAPGTAYSLSGSAYRAYAFPAFRYSDVVWLYLRDNLATRPIPYLDYPLEYPPLTGFVSYVLAFAPGLPSYFALSYLVLAASALGTVAVLARLPGANPWYVAAAPALFFYTGHQWDGLAIFVTALALLAVRRGHDAWGTLGLIIGVSLKLFPVVFVAALLVERLRQRRYAACLRIGGLFAAGTAAINLPVAVAAPDGWAFFYRWNRDRLADSGIWVLWRELPTEQATRLSFLATVVGGLAIGAIGLRRPGPVAIPLGAGFLLWWLCVNKTFTTHLMLWALLAVALLNAPWWLWAGLVVVDVAGFQLGNFLNLYNLPSYEHYPLILQATLRLYDPIQVVRSALLLLGAAWAVRRVWSVDTARGGAGLSSANGHHPAAARGRSPDTRPSWLGIAGARRSMAVGLARSVAFARSLGHRAVRLPWRFIRVVPVVAAYAVATVAMTWPLAARMKDATVVGMDPLLQLWLWRWVQHAVATDPLGLFNANIFHPFDLTLAYTDANLPGALLAWPLFFLSRDAVLTTNLLVLGSFPLAAGGMDALVRRLTGNRAAGFVAGLAFAFLPFRMVHLWHLNWLFHALLPWFLLALLATIDRPSRPRVVLLGLLAAVLAMTSFYLVFQSAIVAAAALLVVAARRRSLVRGAAKPLAAAALLAAALVVPAYLPYVTVRAEQGLERELFEAEHFKARLASYLTTAPWDDGNPVSGAVAMPGGNQADGLAAPHADGHRHLEYVSEDALFPGALVLAGAAVGVAFWRRRSATAMLLAIGGVAFVVALGPSWSGAGGGPSTEEGRISLPYRYLYDHVPLFAAMRVPSRFGGLVGVAVVALAGLGVAAVWERVRPLLARSEHASPSSRNPLLGRERIVAVASTTLLAALVLAELHAAPIPLEPIDRGPEVAAPYVWLAAQGDDGPVMEFPAEPLEGTPHAVGTRRHVGLAMYWSTEHWRPLVNGYSGFVPPAHTEMLRLFLGDLRRADGTIASGISHVGPEHVGLLRQLGVRYLVVHRSQYAAADWPVVEARLAAAEGAIDRVGDFGEATIYRVRETFGGAAEPTLRLFAPSLGTPGSVWGPVIVGEKSAAGPALFSFTERPVLTTTWYDVEGRELRRETALPPLPATMTSGRLLCSTTACDATAAFGAPGEVPLPSPEGEGWRPTEPGHYVVRLVLSGDRPLDCTVDLDVVEDEAEVEERSPDDPHRWAECVEGERYPVNDPGGKAFDALPPSITFAGGRMAVETSLVSRRDEEVQAWFLLAPPGSAAPWQEARYRSPTRQRLTRAGEPAEFEWLEALPADVPPGVYELSLWFHRRDGAAWEHAYGDGFDLATVVVDPGGAARWEGPFRVARTGPLPRVWLGVAAELPLRFDGEAERDDCAWRWRLVATGDGGEVASGGSDSCRAPRLSVPASVPAGRYRLEIDALAVRGQTRRVSDGLVLPLVVTDDARGRPS